MLRSVESPQWSHPTSPPPKKSKSIRTSAHLWFTRRWTFSMGFEPIFAEIHIHKIYLPIFGTYPSKLHFWQVPSCFRMYLTCTQHAQLNFYRPLLLTIPVGAAVARFLFGIKTGSVSWQNRIWTRVQWKQVPNKSRKHSKRSQISARSGFGFKGLWLLMNRTQHVVMASKA